MNCLRDIQYRFQTSLYLVHVFRFAGEGRHQRVEGTFSCKRQPPPVGGGGTHEHFLTDIVLFFRHDFA